MFLSFGFTARSAMRPETMAGPMLRNARPANVSAFIGPASGFFASLSDFFDSVLSSAFAEEVASCACSGVPRASVRDSAANSGNKRKLLDTMVSPDIGVAGAYGSRGILCACRLASLKFVGDACGSLGADLASGQFSCSLVESFGGDKRLAEDRAAHRASDLPEPSLPQVFEQHDERGVARIELAAE